MKRSDEQGISLIELLLAVGLLLTVVTALVRLGIATLSTSDSARVRAVAQQFSDESLELARAARDQDSNGFFALSDGYYIYNSTGGTLQPSNCDVGDWDGDASDFAGLSISSDCYETRDVGGSDIGFYRVIGIKTRSGADDRYVGAFVYWDVNNTFHHEAVTSTILTQWR
ncbi:hypothetical protein KC614_01420 [candidate division WWE3 bacterium]|uniref:Prepilin-type N-terminal cleavage/methylation domain-containing protein n=1 Tax=candidate division WWE3 bacterium TaxID=2053526 RepID=A0A955LK28_UNCKA|nr:hypothetical protein [candidate division WWE3 bacterium]